MKAPSPIAKPIRSLLTVRMLHEHYPAWTEAALRALILNAEDRKNSRGETICGNGLGFAIVRCAGKVLIDEALFLEWVAAQSMRSPHTRANSAKSRIASAQQIA